MRTISVSCSILILAVGTLWRGHNTVGYDMLAGIVATTGSNFYAAPFLGVAVCETFLPHHQSVSKRLNLCVISFVRNIDEKVLVLLKLSINALVVFYLVSLGSRFNVNTPEDNPSAAQRHQRSNTFIKSNPSIELRWLWGFTLHDFHSMSVSLVWFFFCSPVLFFTQCAYLFLVSNLSGGLPHGFVTFLLHGNGFIDRHCVSSFLD